MNVMLCFLLDLDKVHLLFSQLNILCCIECRCHTEWLFCSSVESSHVHTQCLELSVSSAAVFRMCGWCQCVSIHSLPFHIVLTLKKLSICAVHICLCNTFAIWSQEFFRGFYICYCNSYRQPRIKRENP